MAFTEELDRNGLRLREFSVSVGERPVPGVLWERNDAKPDAPLVCFGHGASGDRYQAPIPYLARTLVADHGCRALAIDGPVHGRRKVGDGARGAFFPEWEREGTVADMTADWTAALDFVQSQPDVGSGPVGYWGLSMGTIYGAPFIAEDTRFVVAVLGLMGITGPDHYVPVIEAAAKGITIPVLFLTQLEDELFGRPECIELFDALGSAHKRFHASPGLHSEVPFEELAASIEFLVEGLSGGLEGKPTAFTVSDRTT